MNEKLEFIYPDWPAPKNVRAVTTTRAGGASRWPYESLNLGDHVGDVPGSVARNRSLLRETCRLSSEPVWLKQVHGTNVIDAAAVRPGVQADGAVTDRPGVVCAVLTADCLPIFLCDRDGAKVGLLHAGWRGLAAGIVETGLRRMGVAPGRLLVWLGPAIGPHSYEVGEEVRQAFVASDPGAAAAFAANASGRWLADMYALARRRLHALCVHAIFGGDRCTLHERERFYSFRRDGTTGRMASLIWLERA